jgi:hypothetical protein
MNALISIAKYVALAMFMVLTFLICFGFSLQRDEDNTILAAIADEIQSNNVYEREIIASAMTRRGNGPRVACLAYRMRTPLGTTTIRVRADVYVTNPSTIDSKFTYVLKEDVLNILPESAEYHAQFTAKWQDGCAQHSMPRTGIKMRW